jgi:protein O-GlcNAc transferase
MNLSLASILSEAAALHRSGALAEAAARYREIVRGNPAHADALYHLAQICCQQGRFGEGVELVQRALAVEPQRARLHVLLGRALVELGNAQEALASFDRAIGCEDNHAGAHGNRGDLLAQLGRLDEAVESYQRAISIDPDSLANWCNLGAAQAELGRHDDALASYERATAIEPTFVEAQVIRRNLLRVLGRNADALASYDRALAVAPNDVSALTGRADVLVALKRPEEALASLEQALAVNPSDAGVLSNHGFLLQSLKRHDEALASLERALAIDPNHAGALLNRGALLSEFGRHGDAIASYDRAVAVSPADVRAHCNRSKTLFVLNRYSEALVSAEHALAIDPAHVESQYTRGIALGRLNRYHEAIAAYERVLELAPAHPHALAQLAMSCLAICAWDKTAAVASRLYEAMAAGTAVVAPQILLLLSASPEVTLAAARRYVEREIPPGPRLDFGASTAGSDKIRVAYLSGDFRVHPVAYLMVELFERHDRNRFEIIGLSFGPDDKSELRSRIAKSFDQFHDVRTASDRDAAALMRRLGVDITVDLTGHTDNSRAGILRYRTAPAQVSYLGYPGTMGADFIDYIIADKVLLPFDQQRFYSEKIVHLPDCYQVNDRKRAIAARTLSRPDAGLPQEAFVFCCFNNNYKIGQRVFDIWMRLLKAVPGSVLWLLRDNAGARDTLRREAAARGVDPARLVFAERCSHAAHLARHHLADLFLDTPDCNAGATASDALWAGLPVLTCIGSTLPGRVAASLLHGVGLADMVTGTLDDYAALALKLAREPALLAGIRTRLEQNRLTYPLFDTDRFTRHIERAYETMREHERQGRGPQSFSVEAIPVARG